MRTFTKEWFKDPTLSWPWACLLSEEPPRARCLLCNNVINVSKKWHFISHENSKCHKKAASEVKQRPKSKKGKPTDKKGNSKKTTPETLISTIDIVDLEEPSSQLSVRIPTQNSHFDYLQKKEEEINLQKTEQNSVNFISAFNRSQISVIEERIQHLSKEIEILQHSVIEKAELCETTGNIRYVIESNTFRRITEDKIQELANAKDLLRSIFTNTN